MQNFRPISSLFMEILHLKDLGNTESVVTNYAVWVLNLVIFLYVASDTSDIHVDATYCTYACVPELSLMATVFEPCFIFCFFSFVFLKWELKC